MTSSTPFPIITKEKQAAFERCATGREYDRFYTPRICGRYGRACRQLDKDEGANRALCDGCSLAEFAKDCYK